MRNTLNRLSMMVVLLAIPGLALAGVDGETSYNNTCVSCHGPAAVGMPTPAIQGLPVAYMVQELNNYKSGARHDSAMNAMNGIAAGLDSATITSVATYINSLSLCSLPDSIVAPGLGNAATGKTVAQSHSCLNCHVAGNTMKAPLIDGQKTQYIVNQLSSFKSGTRKSQFMNSMVASLNDRDINDLAAYFNSQRKCQ